MYIYHAINMRSICYDCYPLPSRCYQHALLVFVPPMICHQQILVPRPARQCYIYIYLCGCNYISVRICIPTCILRYNPLLSVVGILSILYKANYGYQCFIVPQLQTFHRILVILTCILFIIWITLVILFVCYALALPPYVINIL